MEEYNTPSHTQQFETELKRSRFITTVGTVTTKVAAKAFIASVRSKYPDANHHCWAMIAGAPDDVHQQDQSDDGEPRGTAGKPILNVLQHSGLGNIVVVVTRYFGGVKLGAGGLVRAYTRSVSDPLKTLDLTTVRLRGSLDIELPYASFDAFEYWTKSLHTEIAEKTFAQTVLVKLLVPDSERTLVIEKGIELGGSFIDRDLEPSQ